MRIKNAQRNARRQTCVSKACLNRSAICCIDDFLGKFTALRVVDTVSTRLAGVFPMDDAINLLVTDMAEIETSRKSRESKKKGM